MAMVESNLGEALGQLYCSSHFSGAAKPKALEIVESVRDALKDRLLEVEWMGEETRAKAMEKMEGFRVQIGFPDSWINYEFFEGKLGADHLANVALGNQFEVRVDDPPSLPWQPSFPSCPASLQQNLTPLPPQYCRSCPFPAFSTSVRSGALINQQTRTGGT